MYWNKVLDIQILLFTASIRIVLLRKGTYSKIERFESFCENALKKDHLLFSGHPADNARLHPPLRMFS
jgi:hypothetical protein